MNITYDKRVTYRVKQGELQVVWTNGYFWYQLEDGANKAYTYQ